MRTPTETSDVEWLCCLDADAFIVLDTVRSGRIRPGRIQELLRPGLAAAHPYLSFSDG